MSRRTILAIWGLLLIVGGILFWIQGRAYISISGTADQGWAAAWAALFAAGALSCLAAFVLDAAEWWWTPIPGSTLLGLATLITLGGFFPDSVGPWTAALFLGLMGLGFWTIYATQRRLWWAIIPGGALLSVAAMLLVVEPWGGTTGVALLFGGLAVTFALLALLPTPPVRLTWAWIPAAVLAVFAVAFGAAFVTEASYIWAVVLIVSGVFLLYRQGGRGHMAPRS